MHGNVHRGGMNKRGPQVDRAVSAFVEDVYQRGLDKNILLVISGEFGRTPRINKRAGRDHWGRLSTLALAGGGLEVGQIVGESSDKAESPKVGYRHAAGSHGDRVSCDGDCAKHAFLRSQRTPHSDAQRRQAD